MTRVEFLQALYACTDGQIELRALPSKHRTFFDVTDHESISEFCIKHSNENIYFGVATRDGKGGGKENIEAIPAVWCDVDWKTSSKDVVREQLKAFPFKPTFTVNSGGGVHMYWLLKEPSEQSEIPTIEDINRRIATYLYADMSACDASRILRIPDTLNHKYDPPKDCSVVQSNTFEYTLEDFLSILPEAEKPKESPTETNGTGWLDCAMNGCGEGERNSTATKLAGYWINKISPKDTLSILQIWNQQNSPPLSEKELNTIVNSVSRYEPEKSKPSVDISNVYTPERMLEEYRKYIKTLKNNRFLTSIKQIDKLIRGVAGGEVLTVIARAGAFKTAFLQNMLKSYVNNSAWGAIFFSIEMPIPNITERYLQHVDKAGGREIEEFYSNNATEEIYAVESTFKKDLRNLYVVPTKVSLADTGAYVKLIESEYNKKIGVIGIDYMGLIDAPGTNEYDVMSRVAKGAKDLAKMINIPVVMLCQTSRKGGEGQTEVTLDMGRGSGAIEEAADFILGMWKETVPGDSTKPESTGAVCKILKNRKGPAGSSWLLDIDPECFVIGREAIKWEPKQSGGSRY